MSLEDSSSTKRTRASGEVLDYLLTEFDNNHNPLPEQRREIADRTNMNEKAVRIWFQNRRAKLRKLERMGRGGGLAFLLRLGLVLISDNNAFIGGGISSSGGGPQGAAGAPGASIPSNPSNPSSQLVINSSSYKNPYGIELNDFYCFIDCLSLSVGLWQRLRSGAHQDPILRGQLVNLAPLTLATVMQHADLLVILLKRNQELNYFFAAVSNNVKVFFRIFYPLSAVATCSLLDNNISQEQNELRLSLLHTPKFSVYFLSTELNQWLICEDFSEGQQVSRAHGLEDPIPHVLVGSKPLLQYLNAYILENQLGGDLSSLGLATHHPLSSSGATPSGGGGGATSLGHQTSPNHHDGPSNINIDSVALPAAIDGDLELRFDWQPQILPLGDLETLPALMASTGSYRRPYVPELAEEPLAPVSYTHQQHLPEAQEDPAQPQGHLNTPQSHDFEFVLGNDFVAHTPLETNATLNQHIDSFIDYNSHYP